MKTEYIARLTTIPENLTSIQLMDEFNFIVEIADQELTEYERVLAMTALTELANQQWETYEVLPDKMRGELDVVAMKFWLRDSVDSTEKLVGIIARLGLSQAYRQLISSDVQNLDLEVQGAIASAIGEFGEDVSAPYSGMR